MLRRAVAAREPSSVALLARAYLDRGYRHEAIELLSPRVTEERTDLALMLGDALTDIGDMERAEEAYRLAVAGGDPAAMNTFGVFLRHRGRPGEAEQMLRRAAEAGDELAPANLVALLWEEATTGEDQRAAVRAAEHWADESRPSTLLGLAYVRAAEGHYAEAEELYAHAARLGAYRGHIEYARFLHEVRDDPEAAEREFAAAEQAQEPGWALAFGRFLADVQRTEEARAYLEHAAYWGSLAAREALEALDGDPYDD